MNFQGVRQSKIQTSQPKISLHRFVIVTVLILLFSFNSNTAHAWKPVTHVALADIALQDALDNGKVTIFRVNHISGEILEPIGEYGVEPEILSALQQYPAQFRAGVIGPDAYPDIITGQQAIHPNNTPGGSNVWLEYLWYRADVVNTAPVTAFTTGYLTHAAGDIFAHTYVNNYTGGEFTFTPLNNAIKHIVLEGYIAKRTPPISSYDISIDGVDGFIYDTLVDAYPGSELNQQLLVGDGNNYSIPYIFSRLRDQLNRDIQHYEDEIDSFNESIDRRKKTCRQKFWKCPGMWAQIFEIEFHKNQYALLNKWKINYKGHWVHDIEDGLRAWPQYSHRIAQSLLFNPNGTNFNEAARVTNNYLNRHLLSMAGAPDFVGATRAEVQNIIDATLEVLPRPLQEEIQALKRRLFVYVVKKATGLDLNELRAYLESPERYFDEVMAAGAGEHTTLRKTNQGELNLIDTGFNNPQEYFDYRDFAPAYNTVVMTKLLLMEKGEVNRLLRDLNSTISMCGENAMLGFTLSMDASNQWIANPNQLVFAEDVLLYQQIFMSQSGEDLSSPPVPPLPEGADVEIEKIVFDGTGEYEPDEYVVITNKGTQPQDLRCWRLVPDDPREPEIILRSYILNPNASCRVYTNETHFDTCGFNFKANALPLWRNTGDCGDLYNERGVLVHHFCY